MRYGMIDIGTNSVRYILLESNSGDFLPIISKKTTTRLGSGLYNDEHRLACKAMEATIEAVKKYVDISNAENADKIICTATSAVRDASNSAEFKASLKKACGIELRILSGENEALAGFLGACGYDADENTVLVDIGGGSTEVVKRKGNVVDGTSYECGCVRLNELFGNDYCGAGAFIEKTLPKLDGNVVWIGGTATAVAMIYKGMKEYSFTDVHKTVIPTSYLRELCGKALKMSMNELCELCSFDVKRAEILCFGLLTIVYLTSNVEFVTVSEKGLVEGVAQMEV